MPYPSPPLIPTSTLCFYSHLTEADTSMELDDEVEWLSDREELDELLELELSITGVLSSWNLGEKIIFMKRYATRIPENKGICSQQKRCKVT